MNMTNFSRRALAGLMLAASAFSLGGSANAQAGCPGCQATGEGGPVVWVPGQGIPIPRNPKTCCDPQLAAIANPATVNQLFKYDLDPAGNLSSNYGIKFQPTPAFVTAVNNSAFIANVMLSLPYSHFIIRAQMRTDNLANQSWPSLGKAHLFENIWNGTNNILGFNNNLYVEDSPVGSIMSSASQPYLRTLVAPTQMKANGTRYVIKLSYWVAYTDPRTGDWIAREITCSNVPSMYIGANINTATNKAGAGFTPQLEAELGHGNSGGNSLSAPVKLTPQEVKDMGLRRE